MTQINLQLRLVWNRMETTVRVVLQPMLLTLWVLAIKIVQMKNPENHENHETTEVVQVIPVMKVYPGSLKDKSVTGITPKIRIAENLRRKVPVVKSLEAVQRNVELGAPQENLADLTKFLVGVQF